jgi:nucleotide-binding universal stress UspA family protein
MFPPKNILFPTDFSDRSAAVAPMAAEFARRFDADLTMLHIAPLFPEGGPEARRLLMDGFATIELTGLRTKRVILGSDDDTAREIAGFAQGHKMDLIVMPTHGYGPFRRFLFGSVTLKVLHDATCPVWTGAHVERPPEYRNIQFRNVLCALDLSGKDCKTLKWAAQFAEVCGAKLTIAHAIPSPISTSAEYMYVDWSERDSRFGSDGLGESPEKPGDERRCEDHLRRNLVRDEAGRRTGRRRSDGHRPQRRGRSSWAAAHKRFPHYPPVSLPGN